MTGPPTVNALLEQVTDDLADLVVPRHSRLPAAAAPVLRPGKLFRPRLTLDVAHALGMNHPDAAVRAALACELLHMSSLIHDDLMDESPHRRGVPALHVAASPASAIAVGNLLLARAVTLAAGLGPEAARVFGATVERLWEGQLMEPELADAENSAPHLRYISLKTAALTEAAAALGALSQDAPQRHVAHLGRFGHAVGMAFQVADDLLDHIGDAAAMGKAVGGDLARGVVSLGAWHAVDQHDIDPRTMDAATLDALAARDASVDFAMAAIGDYLGSARDDLLTVTADTAAWLNARAMIAGMLERGARPCHRHVVDRAVNRWPA